MKNFRGQRGITLVFALLLMAAIMAVSLALSTIIVKEIRLSQNIENSVISYYGAESGLESVLYQYYKDGEIAEESGSIPSDLPFGAFSDWSLEEAVAATEVDASLDWEQDVKEVPLYDVDSGNPFSGLRDLYISWGNSDVEPEQVEWTLLYWKLDGGKVQLEPEVSGANSVKNLVNADEVVNKTIRINLQSEIGSFPNNYAFLLRFKHVGNGGQGKTVSFTVTANDDLEIGQETTLRVSGTSLEGDEDVSRALEVTIPAKQPAFSVFDYVLFSDTGIGKQWPISSPFSPVP